MTYKRRDLVILWAIPVVVAIVIIVLVVAEITGHTQAPFHPMQLRTV